MRVMVDDGVVVAVVEEEEVEIREYDPIKDRQGVEEVERRCEVGPSGKTSVFTDLLGDPICRVRHSPAFLMLVAEMGDEILGMIRGCIKTLTCGQKLSRSNPNPTNSLPVYTKAAYVLGLRVSPSHRRMGIGLKLVRRLEEWFRENGVEYAYMATENDNQASIGLFTDKCGYTKFRTPSILVNPVYAHRVPISDRVSILRLSTLDAEKLYRRRFATTEFFPRDIDSVLNNKLNLGTFLALPRGWGGSGGGGDGSRFCWPGVDKFLSDPPESWAVMSLWNCKDVFTLEVRGVSRVKKAFALATRAVDRALPFLRLPSVPELFRPFGFHFMYGLGGEGPRAGKMMKALCGHAHNLAKAGGGRVVVTEVSNQEPLRLEIPHWKMLSCAEDLWCIKRLGEDYSDGSVGDWTKSPPGLSIFVDPREI